MGQLLDNLVGFPTITHVQREYTWGLSLPSLGLLVDGLVVGKYCQSVTLEQYDIAEIDEYKSGATKQFFAGKLDIATVNMTFICPVPDLVQLYFVKWKKQIVSSSGFYNPSNSYKKDIFIILFDRSGIPSNMVQLKNCFPIKFPQYNLTYEGSNVLKYTVDFKVDTIHMGIKAAGNAFAGILGGTSGVSNIFKNIVGSVGQGIGNIF